MNRSARVIHLIDELRVGGAQTHLVTMLREARRSYTLDHRVAVLFGDGTLRSDIERMGIPVKVFDFREAVVQHRYDRVVRALSAWFRAQQPELVEAHLTWSRLLGLPAAGMARVPQRIGFEHGDIYLKSWKFRAANFIGQFAADRIVVCSEALAQWVAKTHGVSRSRLGVLHNCVDPQKFHPEGVGSAPVTCADDTVLACAVGTLGRGVNKRVDVCIEAIGFAREQGAKVELVVCGDGEQRVELEALAARLGLADAVHFLGTRADVPEVLAACDLFCHAAPFEPFGIVALEAMACALPVLVPNAGGIREAIEDGHTGYLYPVLDYRALGMKIAALASDAGRRREMGAAARAAVVDRFTVAGYVQRLYAMYGFAGSKHSR